ncbi:hypothetical protein Tco_0881882 [Tanacetum coccineum]
MVAGSTGRMYLKEQYEVVVYGEDERSFGLSGREGGVFSCSSAKNPMYTYRECIVVPFDGAQSSAIRSLPYRKC